MGMGLLYAERAVREGAKAVVLWDRNAEALEAAAQRLRGLGSSAVLPYTLDVSSAAEVAEKAEAVLAELGAPDVLINNAGIVRGKYFWEHTGADIDAVMDVNTLAYRMNTISHWPIVTEPDGMKPNRMRISYCENMYRLIRHLNSFTHG